MDNWNQVQVFSKYWNLHYYSHVIIEGSKTQINQFIILAVISSVYYVH